MKQAKRFLREEFSFQRLSGFLILLATWTPTMGSFMEKHRVPNCQFVWTYAAEIFLQAFLLFVA
jgi:hypothetical protein